MAGEVARVPAAAATKSPKKVKAASKPKTAEDKKKAVGHLSSSKMVLEAVTKLDERGGSSFQAIKKFIATTHQVDIVKQNSNIKKAVCKLVDTGKLTQPKGKGATGSFKLAQKAQAVKKTADVKKSKKAAVPKEKVVKPKKKAATSSSKPKAVKTTAEKKTTARKAAPKMKLPKTMKKAAAPTPKPKVTRKTAPKKKQ